VSEAPERRTLPDRTSGSGVESNIAPLAAKMPGRSQFYLPVTQERILKMLRTAMGNTVRELLDDPSVTEISVNSDGTVWADKVGQGRRNSGHRVSADETLRVLSIVADAKGEHIGEDNPSFDAILPGHGYRFVGTLPPLTPGPSLTVRKKPNRVITLAEYEAAQIITAAQHASLVKMCHARENLIIAGGTGSGKTTLANAILQIMAQTGHRIITIEDTPELQNSADDQETMYTVPQVRTMQACLKDALRMHPDRLVFGEVRGAEVRDMLMAWNTGHRGGLCTIHADSALDALYRIEEMLETIPNYQPRPRQIARAIQVVLFIQTTADRVSYPAGRHVREIVRIQGHSESDGYALEPIV
jgi:type IV secretion system protein TrbB